jgi:transcription elongation factor Elf1
MKKQSMLVGPFTSIHCPNCRHELVRTMKQLQRAANLQCPMCQTSLASQVSEVLKQLDATKASMEAEMGKAHGREKLD